MNTVYLDQPALDELRSILEDEFPVLINTYIQDSVLRVREMRNALSAGDALNLRKAAHSLKGASANLGLLELTRHCNDMEDAARLGVVMHLEGAMLLVEAEQERAVQLLQEQLHRK